MASRLRGASPSTCTMRSRRARFSRRTITSSPISHERETACEINVAVREWNDQIIFLRKIIAGGADKSYGIQVARLAGLPAQIIARAKEILANLEQHELNADGRPIIAEPASIQGSRRVRSRADSAEEPGLRPQLTLF